MFFIRNSRRSPSMLVLQAINHLVLPGETKKHGLESPLYKGLSKLLFVCFSVRLVMPGTTGSQQGA